MNDKKFIKSKVHKSLKKLLGIKHAGRQELARIELLSAMVASILLSGISTVSGISSYMNEGRRLLSSVKKQVGRFLKNEHVHPSIHYLPFIKALLIALSSSGRLEIAIDGSVLGKGCMCLMFSVLYKGRALPLIWIVVRKKKGHFKEADHISLASSLHELIPSGVKVVILGDGEFDGTLWQAQLAEYGWIYVLRTSKNRQLANLDGDEFTPASLAIEQGESLFLEHLYFGRSRYTWVNILIWHGKGHEKPLHLVTNLDDGYLVESYYLKRFLIETFFRDTKSKGFNIQKSGLRDPKKLNRLLMCCCIAYILGILGGIKAKKSEFYSLICEQYEKNLSLFQIGLRFIRKLVDLRQWRAFSFRYDIRRNL